MKALLQGRDFWFRYHGVTEDQRLEAQLAFSFPWNDRLELRLQAGAEGSSLSLVERGAAREHSLGWWDEVRWHPFALRWSELEMLVRRWDAQPDATLPEPFPLLLLARYVGFGVDDSAERRIANDRVVNAYRRLGFSAEEVATLAQHTIPEVTEDDYRWTRDAELGWVFGGEYPCYSLRNRAHSDGAEGAFPFEEFRQCFSDLT